MRFICILVGLCSTLVILTDHGQCQEGKADNRPNVILILIDDMGWGDFSCFGNRDAKTPHIDRLAKEGIRFEQFYVNSPICSPSRVAISTGQYPQRWKITSYLSNRNHNQQRGMAQWLSPDAPMLARELQKSGYATGHFGKWHMGGQRNVDNAPAINKYGFDESLTNFEGMGPKLLPLTMKPGWDKPKKIWQDAERLGEGYRWMMRSKITSGFVNAAINFARKAQKNNKPFYVNIWPDDVHSPFWPSVERWNENKRTRYLAVLEEMDKQLGLLFDTIRNDPELNRNTVILICSDNGPEKGAGSAGGLRGYKTQLYEGGIRSSLIAWGPGILDKRNHTDKESVFSAIDLVPTLLDLTKTTHPKDHTFDGESLVQTLKGRGGSRKQALCFSRPPDRDSFYGDTDLPDLAIRSGNWKLLCEFDGSQLELFDLSLDPSESIDVAVDNPATAKKLKDSLIRWYKTFQK